MARYDGLIIPRSYSDYISKSDAATLSQALQQSGALDEVPTANSARGARSGGIFSANAVIMASNTTVTGPAISSRSILRIMFTSAVTGSNTTTAMSITYNGTAYTVKVGKTGSLSDFVASYVDSAYKYVQAYTTLELAFNGSNFIIIGNPVVISSSDYTIYADGVKKYNLPETVNSIVRFTTSTSGAVYSQLPIGGYFNLTLYTVWSGVGSLTIKLARQGSSGNLLVFTNSVSAPTTFTSVGTITSDGGSLTIAVNYSIKVEDGSVYIGRASADSVARENVVYVTYGV